LRKKSPCNSRRAGSIRIAIFEEEEEDQWSSGELLRFLDNLRQQYCFPYETCQYDVVCIQDSLK
jgi:hypothetical protein